MSSTLFKFLMYADDTNLYCSLNNSLQDVTLNIKLGKVSKWLACNKLSLNVNKTKFMIFHTKQIG